MTVSELIEHLKTQQQELQVVFQCCSEYLILESNEIKVMDLCAPRPDGWVHDKRPDKPTQKFLVFPGN